MYREVITSAPHLHRARAEMLQGQMAPVESRPTRLRTSIGRRLVAFGTWLAADKVPTANLARHSL